MAIEEIEAGDLVLARPDDDPEAPCEWQPVEETFNRAAHTCRLTLAGREIVTTLEHPFWVNHLGWTPAAERRILHFAPSRRRAWIASGTLAPLTDWLNFTLDDSDDVRGLGIFLRRGTFR